MCTASTRDHGSRGFGTSLHWGIDFGNYFTSFRVDLWDFRGLASHQHFINNRRVSWPRTKLVRGVWLSETFSGWWPGGVSDPLKSPLRLSLSLPLSFPLSFATLGDFWRLGRPKGSARPPKVHPLGYHYGSLF